ncbi:hypothetical protein GSY63_24130 [Mucilaginibacter sp. R11]|uniref:DUF3098 domain-containing protein n=1 Tax=Mucilaginibacter agri TaxID=2695265 RepID=A0A966DWF4_9SPHI|nr:hypothetical protein [Mucilaginibacter agri]
MNRRIGIALILLGIGALVGSGYLFPATSHKMDLGPGLLNLSQDSFNGWPYIAAIICFAGIVFLLNSPEQQKK